MKGKEKEKKIEGWRPTDTKMSAHDAATSSPIIRGPIRHEVPLEKTIVKRG